MSKNELLEEKLKSFLVEAKKQAYANALAEKAESSRVGSKDYHFSIKRGDMIATYHDTYFGTLRFMGEEVVYINSDEPIWGMNYYGMSLKEGLNEAELDQILRSALMKVGEDTGVLPVRGPRHFEYGDYSYSFRTEGDLANFDGVEEIRKGEELVYRLRCHGGYII